MDKKKVGELEGTPIVIGKKNYANEHEYYLTMNEDNTYKKLELRVSGDKFRLVLGGGGNDYPTPTAGDVNKVWQVTPVQKGTKIEETVIVPEQTLINGQELEYNDKFVPGTQCVAVIDGVEYRGEVVEKKGSYVFETEFCAFKYDPDNEIFLFYNFTELPEVTAKLSVIEEVPDYDYNWAPGVKIPIPTAEDEGKILVVTKTEGNTSTIAPEQEVPADNQTPLTDVDLKYFVPGNTVTATVIIQQNPDEEGKKGGDVLLKGSESSNSDTLIVSGTIVQEDDGVDVVFNEGQENEFYILKVPYYEPETPFIPEGPRLINTKSSTDTEYILITNLYLLFDGSSIDDGNVAKLGGNTIPYATIKLEYGEPNYEYLLQENSGSGSSGGFKYNELPEPTVTRELTDEDLSKLPTSNYLPSNSSYDYVIDLDNGLIPDKLILYKGGYYGIMRLSTINPNGGGAEGVIWVLYEIDMYVVSADGSIMARIKSNGGLS